MKNLIVTAPAPLLEYLLANIEKKSKNNIKTLLKNGSVVVDDRITTKFDHMLKEGQVISFKTTYLDADVDNTLDVIFEDKDIIVINKPEGLLSIATDKEKEKTAYILVSNYLKKKKKSNRVFIIHRLDRDTSGVLMFAKSEHIKNLYQDEWNNLVVKRGYLVIVEGKTEKSGTVRSWLHETKSQFVFSSKKREDGKEAITDYIKLKNTANFSLLDVDIKTGRRNQIRVHMSDIGHPIVGDKKYGSTTNPVKRLGLHAYVLELYHPVTKKLMRFEAVTPQSFSQLFDL